jgi:hypothetical protein
LSFPLLLFPSVSGQQPLPFQLFLGLWRELNMDPFLKHPLEEAWPLSCVNDLGQFLG